MTVQQAYKIFDVRSDITKMELKKRYRRLMHMVHPDAVLNRDKSNKENVYRYSAYEINEAYTVLFNQTGQESLKSNYKYDYKYSEYDEKYYSTDQEMKNMILQLQRMNMPFANAMCIIMLKITMATTLEDLRLHEADICGCQRRILSCFCAVYMNVVRNFLTELMKKQEECMIQNTKSYIRQNLHIC